MRAPLMWPGMFLMHHNTGIMNLSSISSRVARSRGAEHDSAARETHNPMVSNLDLTACAHRNDRPMIYYILR